MRDVSDVQKNFVHYFQQLFPDSPVPETHSINVNNNGSRGIEGVVFTDNEPGGAIRVDHETYWSIIELAARKRKSAGEYLKQVIRVERVQERRQAKADKYRESRARAARKEVNAQRAKHKEQKNEGL